MPTAVPCNKASFIVNETRFRRNNLPRLALLFGAGLVFCAAINLPLLSALPSLCPARNILGLPCATCGMTRALVSLTHGDLAQAIELNAGSLILGAWFLGVIFYVVGGQVGLYQLWPSRIFLRSYWTIIPLGLFLAYGGLRAAMVIAGVWAPPW